MKKIYVLASLALTINAFAQPYVLIPDAHFVSYLQATIPAAMHGDSLNTSSPLVTTTTDSINVNSTGVANLFGVQYFTSLKYLICQQFGANPPLTKLPPSLPATLIYLNCSGNQIHCFPTFPNSITTLNIDPNPYNCLPNYIAAMDSTDLATPLCAVGNTHGCPVAVTGIDPVTNNNIQITAYPNPTSQSLFVSLNTDGRTTIKLINVTGQTVYNNVIGKIDMIDISNFTKGVYMLVVTEGTKTGYKKVIVE